MWVDIVFDRRARFSEWRTDVHTKEQAIASSGKQGTSTTGMRGWSLTCAHVNRHI